jgi:hypothetical protein
MQDVIPAKAGIHVAPSPEMDRQFRGIDKVEDRDRHRPVDIFVSDGTRQDERNGVTQGARDVIILSQ